MRRDAVQRLRAVVKEHGVKKTGQFLVGAVVDVGFDLRHGTDTKRQVAVADLDAPGPNQAFAVRYEATRPCEFHRVMSRLDLPPGAVFVDYGSGKGRVLLMASRYDVSRLIGVEFAPALCEVARANVAAHRRKRPSGPPVTVVEADAAERRVGDDENVFFFYNPFAAEVFTAVLDRIDESLDRCPRQIWIVYHNPLLARLVEERGFRPVGSEDGLIAYRVYTNR